MGPQPEQRSAGSNEASNNVDDETDDETREQAMQMESDQSDVDPENNQRTRDGYLAVTVPEPEGAESTMQDHGTAPKTAFDEAMSRLSAQVGSINKRQPSDSAKQRSNSVPRSLDKMCELRGMSKGEGQSVKNKD